MRNWRSRLAFAGLAALVVGALAATAHAITVYSNDFASEAEYNQIVRSGGGKQCQRRYREGQKTMLTSIKRGPATCAYKAPVQGDNELPNHALGVDAKILPSTPKSVRDGAFVELTLRAGGSGIGYTLRVFPQKRKFELVRGPQGGSEFPASGKDKSIKPVGDRNRLSLVTQGARVIASANGKELANVVDNDPGQVTGRKVRFAIGAAKKSGKDVIAVVKTINVGVPDR